ncbi:glycosyltransferase family 2 protein [Methylobacterium oryzisoli]|uniref:glycosyltransferase family 2 protein n=1 Tax=Methylobacterium oryzisoli TaxID=3385502 RepID=UPI0038922375
MAGFRLEPHPGDPDFTRRLVLDRPAGGRWLALTYAGSRFDRPIRPMLRFVAADGAITEALLPGPVLGRADWIGPVPPGTTAILLAAPEPGLRIEAARLLRLPAVLVRAARRPDRLALALSFAARGDRRRFHNTLRIAAAVTPMADYAAWKAREARAFEPALDRSPPADPLRIGLLIEARTEDAEALRRTLGSLLAQSHRDWRLAVRWHGAPAALPSEPRVSPIDGPGLPDADAIGVLHPGDVLAPDALALLAAALAHPSRPEMVYADDEVATAGGLRPRLKPGWSPDLALATLYTGRPTLITRDLVARSRWSPADGIRTLALAAALAVAPDRVRHVARILCRCPAEPEAHGHGAALAPMLARAGVPARPREEGGTTDLLWPLPDPPPLVSVVIPTRDRPDLIRVAVRGVLEETDYPALELVLVDNGSTDPAVADFYARLAGDPRVRRLDRPGPFNFSALVNAGVAASRGAVVVLLNNDVEVREARWLAEMVRLAVRPGIGAVGAKLLYGNGRLQHAGVVVGLGGRAGHILRNRPADTPGHLGRLRVTHEVAGVTAACLAVGRAAFDRVGGFDAQAFAVDFNDIDFCLRLGAEGLRTLWTPHAVLAHHESVSRGPAVGAARERFEAEAARFTQRWRTVIRDDPYYHPALSVTTFGEDLE